MTKDEIMVADIEAIETRMAEIKAENVDELSTDEIEARSDEMEAIEERKAILKAEAAQQAELRAQIAEGKIGKEIETIKETNTMTIAELRNSPEYIDAYAEYIKTSDETELRSLLTEMADEGTIAVPDMVLDIVKTAWDKNEIMSLVNKVSIKGNLKVNFEISGTDAVAHAEGSGPVTEETLTEGIVTLLPGYIKKWISISDEVLAMRGAAFLEYIYAELTMKITKKVADSLIGLIAGLPQVATDSNPAVAKISAAPALGTIADAIAHLSDEASNPTIVMNKLTWSAFKAAQYAGNYGVDIFEGLKVVFNNSLPAYGTASTGAVYAIVGDFHQGSLANFPEGETVKFVFDDKTLATSDLVRVIGKEYVAVGVVACNAFTVIAKPANI